MSRILVTLHGIGRIEQSYWRPITQAIAPHLGGVPRLRSVWWGDLIDAGAHLPAMGAQVAAGFQTLARRFFGRPALSAPRVVGGVTHELHGLVNSVAGVLAYFVFSKQQALIRHRLREAFAELTARQDEIVLVSESLGCLVAFDVLRAEADRYNLAAWFTMGCPLRTLVRTGQRRPDLGHINPQTVKQWVNLYAPLDLIAAPIAAVFPAYPICDERIDGARGPVQAHTYWPYPRVPALIAGVLRG